MGLDQGSDRFNRALHDLEDLVKCFHDFCDNLFKHGNNVTKVIIFLYINQGINYSHKTISEEIQEGYRNTFNSLKRLEDDGLVERVGRYRNAKWRMK